MATKPGGEKERQLGTGTTLRNEGSRIILNAGGQDVIVITQTSDQLRLIVNGQEDVTLTALESSRLELQGNRSSIFADHSVKINIKGLAGTPVKKPTAQAGLRLAKARQRSSAFGAALAQQRIIADFQKDPFLVCLGEQLHKLASYFGVQLYRPTAPRSALDLVPLFKEMAKTLDFQVLCNPPADSASEPGQESAKDLYQGLSLSFANAIEWIKNGAEVDLDAVASQLTETLARLQKQRTKIELGKIPPEFRPFRPGQNMRSLYEHGDAINVALSSEEFDKRLNAAANIEALGAALREEKAALLEHICADWKKWGHPPKCADAVVTILSSSESPEELESLLQSARSENLQALFEAAPGMLPDLNITVGVLSGRSPLPHPESVQIARDGLNAGFSPRQLLNTRRSLQALLADGKKAELETIADSTLYLAVCTVQNKTEFLLRLCEGRPSRSENRAVLALLQSTRTAEEFADILAAARDENLHERLLDPEARQDLSLLSGAYDQMQFAPDSEAAKGCHRLLLSNSGAMSQPAKGGTEVTDGDAAAVAALYIQKRLGFVDRNARVISTFINAPRQKEGKAALNPASLRGKADEILRDPHIPEKERKSRLLELGMQEGIPEEAAGRLLLPLAHTYVEAAEEAEQSASSLLGKLRERARRCRMRLGKESKETIAANTELAAMESQIESLTFRMHQSARLLREIYAPPPEGLRKGRLGR